MITDFRRLRVTVMGLGTFGGGLGAAKFLIASGAEVTVTDLRDEARLQVSMRELQASPPARWRLGQHHADDFLQADLVVASPAVPWDSPWLQLAREAGVPITSEISLFWERNHGQIAAVTGSNGKSTTTTLLHALLTELVSGNSPHSRLSDPRRIWLGGNIGRSLLPQVHEIASRDWVVLELSSFQLQELAGLRPAPQIAVVTNFTPNHLDRHGSVEAYRAAKQNILRFQTSEQQAVLGSDDADVATWPTNGRVAMFGLRDPGGAGVFAIGPDSTEVLCRFGGREWRLPLRLWLEPPGDHNLKNALAATAAALLAGAGTQQIEQGMRGFRGLPHRLEQVAQTAGRRFYNDSKATTPEAAVLGLRAFEGPLVLLAGGHDKQVDLTPLAQEIVDRRVRAAALMGATADRLEHSLTEIDPRQTVPRRKFGNFEEAFRWGVAQSHSGDVVLLSPGCASYDWFENYEQRGDLFRTLAQGWKGPHSDSAAG